MTLTSVRPRREWEDNIKMDLKYMWGRELNCFGIGLLAGCSEHRNGPSDSIKTRTY
jgi:hypothetical protein